MPKTPHVFRDRRVEAKRAEERQRSQEAIAAQPRPPHYRALKDFTPEELARLQARAASLAPARRELYDWRAIPDWEEEGRYE